MDDLGILRAEPIQDILILRFHVLAHLLNWSQSGIGKHQMKPSVILR